MEDLEPLNFFLGVEVVAIENRLFLSQQKYILDMLEKFELYNAKPTATPLANSVVLKSDDGTATVDDTKYRQLVGSLQYLTLTHPDVSFSINKLSQFMHCPRESH